MSIAVEVYVTPSGKSPYFSWEKKLDRQVRGIVSARIARLKAGNFGDCKSLVNAKGLYELRIDFGPGYRLYFGKKNQTLVILLLGGVKKSQKSDIEKAKLFWEDYLNG